MALVRKKHLIGSEYEFTFYQKVVVSRTLCFAGLEESRMNVYREPTDLRIKALAATLGAFTASGQ